MAELTDCRRKPHIYQFISAMSNLTLIKVENLKSQMNKNYLKLLSRPDKNLPKILTASTRNPPLSSMVKIVPTHSYRIALPAFLFDSVLVAT